jgi:tetratricopeptide (TPR) repeat protein
MFLIKWLQSYLYNRALLSGFCHSSPQKCYSFAAMQLFSKIAFPISALLILIISCGDKKEPSPFENILAQAPYKIYTDSINQFPTNDLLHFNRAVLLNSNNQPEAALADFEQAWAIAKKEQYAVGVATLLSAIKNDKAISFIQLALKELPESNLLRIALARNLNDKGSTEEALQVCNEVLAQNSQQVDIIKIKAALLDKKGQAAESIRILAQAYQLTPYDIELNYELAYKYAEQKNALVLRLCDSLIKIDTANRHAEPAYYKGIYYSNIGNKQAAIEQFNKALQNDYYYLNAYIEKSRILFEQKKYEEALKVVEKANTLSPDFADAWYWMGKCKEALNRKTEALTDYQSAYALDKTFVDAKEALDALKK